MTQPGSPPGNPVRFSFEFNDHHLIWDALDKVRGKHPDMVLLHGGSPKGAERIAARWADHRKVPQIAFKPDWTKHAKAAPFKRNDQLLDVLPIAARIGRTNIRSRRRLDLTDGGGATEPPGPRHVTAVASETASLNVV